MANKLLTIFQNLDNAITGNWDMKNKPTPHVNSYDFSNMSHGQDVVYKANDKEDYIKTKLELQQNAYLNNRWLKANVDLSVQAFNGLNNIKLMYRDADLMDSFPEIGAALDIVSEESCLDGNTQIELLNGDIKTIKELYDEDYKDFFCYTVDENGICKPTQIEGVICNGKKQIYVLTLDDNTIIHCTDNHKWLKSDNEWIETKDLFIGCQLKSIQKLKNHEVISIKVSDKYDYAYDLINSSVNHSYSIKCNDGQVICHNCITNSKGKIINVYSKSERIKNVLEDLFTNRLDIQVTAPMIVRAMCKYGNQFMLMNIDNKNGISGWRQLPVFNVERLENGIENQYSVNNSANINKGDMSTKFVWVDANNTQTPFRNWQIGHFRLLTNSLYLPYGVSYLNPARRHWRMLSLMEDMMLIYRLERSIERRVYKIFVGAIDDADVKAYVEDIANNFKRTPIIDPLTGQIDLRKNILSADQDIFIPVRDPNTPTPIDTLQAAQNLTAMDDIKFVQNKVLTALRIPKTFLNFEDAAGDGKNLALMDVRFTRTINRIQQAFLMELTKIASIHLYILGFDDELTNFSLSMNNPSTQAEQLEIENIQKKISAIRDAVADPGNGIPIMSQTRALKEIMKWSDKDIQNNLEEIRLEKAIASELEKTTQIIKKTGVFDIVDKMYGEPGADYQDDMSMGQESDSMNGGSLGDGSNMPPDMGANMNSESDIDELGTPGAESDGDISGNEGEIPMDNGNDADTSQPMETIKNKKPLITENKMLDKLFLDRFSKRNETLFERAEILDKTILINEEFDSLIKSLNELKK